MKHFLSLLLLTALLTGALPTFALAESGSNSDDQVIEGGDPDDDTNDVDQGDDDDDDDDSSDNSDDDDDDSNDDDNDDGVDTDVESDEDVEVDEDLSDEMEDEMDDLLEDVLKSEGESDSSEGGDETIVSEEVDESDLSDEAQEALEEATLSGDLPDTFYLSVKWGLFPAVVPGDSVTGTETDWSGSISFADDDSTVSLMARPYKLVRFEKDQDAVDFESTTAVETVFDSLIYVHNDGILFKVRTDLEDTNTKVVFDTAYQNSQFAVYVSDLLASDGVEFSVGEYSVVMKVWTREDWVEEHSKHRGGDEDSDDDSDDSDDEDKLTDPTDAEDGAWYSSFMNYSVDAGFFQGYRDPQGELTGEIGPGDSLTRFQLLKVLTRLSESLELGVGTLSCDEETNITNAETAWMEGHWARGYVQCALDSDYSVTLLEEIINEDLEVGDESTLRWEVLVTAAELLGVEVPERDTTTSDVEDSDLDEDEKDSIDYFYELGVVSGYPDGSFKPERTVNRAEMFKIVVLLLETLGM